MNPIRGKAPLICWSLLIAILVGLMTAFGYEFPVLVIGALGLVAIFWFKPLWGYTLLVTGSMITSVRFATPVGHFRIDQVLSLFSLVSIIRLRDQTIAAVSRDLIIKLLAGWLLINILASIFAAVPFQSEKIAVWLLLDFIGFMFVIRICFKYGYKLPLAIFYSVGMMEIVFALLGIAFHFGLGSGRVMGTMEEPDIFGAFSSAMGIVNIFLIQTGRRREKFIGMVGFAGAIIAAYLSGTRSSVAGLFIVLLILAIRDRRIRSMSILTLAIGMVAIAMNHGTRLSNFANSSTLAYRMVRVKEALAGWFSNWRYFLLGHGTNSYGETHFVINSTGNVVGDYLMVQGATVFYDTGLLGMILFSTLLGSIALRIYTLNSVQHVSPMLKGSAYALLSLMIAYQATNGVWFEFSWVFFAFAVLPVLIQKANAGRTCNELVVTG